MLARLEPAASVLVDRAIGAALPLWAAAGFDDEQGRFEERLTLRGERLPDVPLRLMSQARQIHAYALAAQRGWHDGLPLIDRAYGAMVNDFHRRDGGAGWVFSIRRDGTVVGAAVRHALWGHADRHGFDASGMIHSELLADGTPRAGPRRIWPVTEAIKLNLIEARHGRGQGKGGAAELAVLLRQRFLTTDLAGGWRDKLDHEGRCMSKFMPASTLYHLMGAIEELSQSCLASEAGVGALA